MSHGPLLPSGRQRGLPFIVPDDWTPEQALAVIELIDDLRECIATHYQTPLQELLRQQRSPPGNPHPRDIDADPF